MHTALITTWEEFQPLESEWNSLLRSSRSDTIFLTWEWVQSWREVVGNNLQPLVVTVRDANQRLVGVAPYYRYQIKLFGLFSFKALRFFADYATGAEYPDWFVSPDCEEQALHAIAEKLLQSGDLWDIIWMPKISGWSGAFERITQALQSTGLLYHSRPAPFSSFPLPDTLEKFEAGFSAKRRQQMRRYRKNVLSPPEVRIVHCRTQDQLPGFLNALFDLHHRRRELLGDPGCFIRRPAEAAFYKNFLPRALDNNWLRFAALTHDGEFQAIQIGYVYRNIFHSLQEGFNPNYVQRAGNALRHTVIEECIAEGLDTYDFLGDFTEHKRRWGAREYQGYDLMIGRPSITNRLLFFKEIWPSGRFIEEYGLFKGAQAGPEATDTSI